MARRRLILALLAVGLAAPSRAGAAEGLWPDQLKVQFAGLVGFLSAGGGWDLSRGRLEVDVLAGWVPARYAGEGLATATGKLTWLPWTVPLGRGWRLRPLTAGLALTYTFGDQFWVVLPARYPRLYYELPSAIRSSLSIGGTLGRRAGRLQELGVYWEVVAGDIALASWVMNRDSVDARNVLSVALGVRLER